MIFLDTCFILYEIKQGNSKKLKEFVQKKDVYITSFNLEELKYVEKKFGHLKHQIRDFIKHTKIYEIPVKPGNPEVEKKYIQNIDENILSRIHDPSDAVLIATAIQCKADVITRDKHHLFTTDIENEIKKYNIKIWNKFPVA